MSRNYSRDRNHRHQHPISIGEGEEEEHYLNHNDDVDDFVGGVGSKMSRRSSLQQSYYLNEDVVSESSSSEGSSWEEDDGFVGWNHDSRLRRQEQRQERRFRKRRSIRKPNYTQNNSNSNKNKNRNDTVDGNDLVDGHGGDKKKSDSDSSSDSSEGGDEEGVSMYPPRSDLWSVRVRLISAVDLPLNLSPKLPLCPLFKFGLSGQRTLVSSCKILPKHCNGAMEWHEEMRWDNIVDPLNTELSVELATRAVLPHHDASPRSMMRYHSAMTSHNSASTTVAATSVSEDGSSVGNDSNSNTTEAKGFFGMWRKGRQQLEIQKKKREQQKHEAAAAVAQFLVKKPEEDVLAGIDDHTWNQRQSRVLSTADMQELQDAQLLTNNSSSTNSNNNNNNSSSTNNNNNNNNNNNHQRKRRNKKKRKKLEAQDIPLGSLQIPLSKLPLEQDRPTVEKWYPLQQTSTPTNQGLHDDLSAGEHSLQQRRSPSILLEISFCTSELLDESEDEADMNIALMYNQTEDAEDVDHNNNNNNTSSKPNTLPNIHSNNNMQQMEDHAVLERRRSSVTAAKLEKENKEKLIGPALQPGIVDYIAVVGAKEIGDRRNDDGSRGWVNSTPECGVLETFPPDDKFHHEHNRSVSLGEKMEWFCWPEGCKLWRGAEAPTHLDMNLKRFSASSPPTMASSIAAFDACLNCTTSFTWFVMCNNTAENSFRTKKTYGAVIRFYAPAPPGVDPTQDDYAQTTTDPQRMRKHHHHHHHHDAVHSNTKRLWIPLAICMTSSLPIIGILEAMLLRLCEKLASRANSSPLHHNTVNNIIQSDIANLIVNYPAPIAGVINCSIPFLSGDGDRLLVTIPPYNGLPPLPHGASVTSVCRLLSAEGLTVLLAAVLTENKILIHSADVANLAMVAEVITALIYPFHWQLPYIPVLPEQLLEYVEAPLSYFVGIPSCNMKWLDKSVLSDVVVIDLDNGLGTPDYFDGRRGTRSTIMPTQLPASVANNIQKAVFRLLREEEEVEEQFGTFSGARHLPRLEGESLAEREFRIAVALQICGLIRGYQECLFFVSASQPVFNRDRFLRQAPALYEERRGTLSTLAGTPSPTPSTQPQRILSPRSKRFLSNLVNTQHFHALLENLDSDDTAFFHEVMDTFDRNDDVGNDQILQYTATNTNTSNSIMQYGSPQQEEACKEISATLERVEQKIPTYHVSRTEKKKKRFDEDDDDVMDVFDDDDDDMMVYDLDDGSYMSSFTHELLQPVYIDPKQKNDDHTTEGGTHQISLQHLVEMEKKPWQYQKILDISLDANDEDNAEDPESSTSEQQLPDTHTPQNDIYSSPVNSYRHRARKAILKATIETKPKPFALKVWPHIHLKEALGDRKFRAWKSAQEKKHNVNSGNETSRLSTNESDPSSEQSAIDLKVLLLSATDENRDLSHHRTSSKSESQKANDAKDREVIQKCLEKAYEGASNRPAQYARRSSEIIIDPERFSFKENGVDLVKEAEAALRNPSAQRFLVSVLSQRTRLGSKRKRRWSNNDKPDPMGARQRQSNQSSVSRLQPSAFDCLVRLCNAMLEACMQELDYEAAYRLLTHTAGFCTVSLQHNDISEDQSKIIYMTKRIGMHPIFGDLRLWERVLLIHQQDRQKDKVANLANNSGGNGRTTPPDRAEDNVDADEYEAAVSTLYEMLGYGVAAEDLAKFATRVADNRGWFSTERGHKLLVLARRLSVKRDEGDFEGSGGAGEIDLMKAAYNDAFLDDDTGLGAGTIEPDKKQMEWKEIAWSHPVIDHNRMGGQIMSSSGYNLLGNRKLRPIRGTSSQFSHSVQISGNDDDVLDPEGCQGRVAVTSLASFGSSVVATGGLDGSIFLAHTIHNGAKGENDKAQRRSSHDFVDGILLEWDTVVGRAGITSPSNETDSGIGAVTCLAAARGPGYRQISFEKESLEDKDEMLMAMEGCRIIAGTTCGELRLWSVKDVCASVMTAKDRSHDSMAADTVTSAMSDVRLHGGNSADSASSAFVRGSNGPNSRSNKNPLKGRPLSGHRGGVCCLDVPSHIYRPDSLVTGGGDGLIKLWSLRQSNTIRRSVKSTSVGSVNTRQSISSQTSATKTLFGRSDSSARMDAGTLHGRSKGAVGIEPQDVLTGHGGKILCVKVAWHGDRLLSGGADRTLRSWDLQQGGGKCINTMGGHLGWVTHVNYWGPHTMISASTDRAIALWDARAGNSPLFVLRYHRAPVSSLLIGSRTEFQMVSAAADGAVATWDFRRLASGTGGRGVDQSVAAVQLFDTQTIREPIARMNHCQSGKKVKSSGEILLSNGSLERSVLSVGVDGKMKEWDMASGRLLSQQFAGHSDVVSCLSTFSNSEGIRTQEDMDVSSYGGTITASWDGTVQLRKLVQQKSSR